AGPDPGPATSLWLLSGDQRFLRAVHLPRAPPGGKCTGGGTHRSTSAHPSVLVRRGEIWERWQQRVVTSAVEIGTVVRDAITDDRAIGQHKQRGVDHIVLEQAPARERGRAIEPAESGRIAA